jgi:cation diffusion facilitator family transporter
MDPHPGPDTGLKVRLARASALAAVLLTGGKLAVGLWTGSLGILAEAAHSGLDLVAAVMTWAAVARSDRPADADHPYGHHKLDNLSALFETLLLLVTCGWIVYEAVQRLFFKAVEVEVTWVSFAVILAAIAVDYSRGRALARAARITRSAALEADALHFTSDIASSLVVLLGLGLTRIGYPQADALCSIGVAVIVAWIGVRLGKKAVDALADRVPPDHVGRVESAAGAVQGVRSVFGVRVRHTGPRHFIDLKVTQDPGATLAESHAITERVERAVAALFQDVDVVVHAEPDGEPAAGLLETLWVEGRRMGVSVHSARLFTTGEGLHLEMHLEWARPVTLGEAHREATDLEQALHRAFPELVRIRSHLEAGAGDRPSGGWEGAAAHADLAFRVEGAARAVDGVLGVEEVQVRSAGERLAVGMTCRLDGALPLADAHRIATRVERSIYGLSPAIASVAVHTEPADVTPSPPSPPTPPRPARTPS